MTTDLLDPLLNHLISVGGSGLVMASHIRPRMHVDGSVISIEDGGPFTEERLRSSLARVRQSEIKNAGRSVYELHGHLFVLRSWTGKYGTTIIVRPVDWVEEDDQ